MHRLIRCGGLFLLLLALIVPTFAGDGKKDGDEKKEVKKKSSDEPEKKGKAEPKEKSPSVGTVFDAKLTQMDTDSTRDFTVQITHKYQEVNADVQRQLAQQQQQLAQHQAQLKRARNANDRQQAQQNVNNVLNQIAQSQRNLYKVKEVSKEYKLRATDEMKVRVLYPAPEYDEKGVLKKFTEKELKARKGPGNLPGYAAELDALRTGQMVRIYLARAPVPVKGAPTKAKKITEEDEPGLVNRPEVAIILILGESQQK